MQKFIALVAAILLTQSSHAAITDLQIKKSPDFQVSKETCSHLIKSRILVINPDDNSLRFNLQEDATKSLLEKLNDKGLLNEEIAGNGPICD